jgi:hypothetical protein
VAATPRRGPHLRGRRGHRPDFVATFTPYDLHGLPEPCRPSPKLYPEDITPLAFELVRYQCAHAEMADAVQGLAPFFARASARLAQLAVYERVRAVAPAAR